MLSMKRNILFFLFCLFSFTLFSEGLIDSLKTDLKNATDTNRVRILNQLAEKFELSNLDSSYHYALLAFELAKDLKFEKGLANSYFNIGNYFHQTDKYQFCLIYVVSFLS